MNQTSHIAKISKQIWEESEMMFLHPNVKRLSAALLTLKSLEITKLFEIPIQRNILQLSKRTAQI